MSTYPAVPKNTSCTFAPVKVDNITENASKEMVTVTAIMGLDIDTKKRM
jgi:hypothetical protein